MQLGRLVLYVLVLVPMTALLSLPGEMAKEFVVSKLTDAAADYLGMSTLSAASMVSALWTLLPFLAAIALLSLYHSLNRLVFPPPQAPVVESPSNRSILRRFREAVLLIILAAFVAAVLVAGYHAHSTSADKLSYHLLTQLNNYELRERAFQVAAKIDEIRVEYVTRQEEVYASFNKALEGWTKDSAEYDKRLAEYNTWLQSHPFGGMSSLSLMGQSPPPQTTQPPPPGSPPGPRPEPPVITVDREWQRQAEEVQEEAAAVWEEIAHRLGHYPALFQIPTTYMPEEKLGRTRDASENSRIVCTNSRRGATERRQSLRKRNTGWPSLPRVVRNGSGSGDGIPPTISVPQTP